MTRDLFSVMILLAAIVAPPSRAAAAGKPSVAVLYFDNDTGDAAYDHLGKGLADMMITDLASVPSFGVVPEDSRGPRVKMPRAVCFHELDPSYAKASLAALDRARAAVDEQAAADKDRSGSWREERSIEIDQFQALIHLALNKPEDAVAKLQGILSRYPKSRHFAETETYLRAMLSGSGKLPDGQPLVPGCADPR